MTTAPLSLVGSAATVPWGCWDPDTTLELSFPPRFTVQVNAHARRSPVVRADVGARGASAARLQTAS